MKQYKKSDYCYTALFCEENIWHLARSLIDEGIKKEDIDILFLTNKNKQIVIFKQLSAEPNQPVIWDYHVILMAKIMQSNYIFDFDTRLDFITSYDLYLKNSLPDNINPLYQSQIRIIPSQVYLKQFYSDRSHMKGIISEDEFPDYPAINSSSEKKIELKDLFNVEKSINRTMIFHNSEQLLHTLRKKQDTNN